MSTWNAKSEEKSLEYLYPKLAKEWHPSKNGSLTPQEIKARACKSVWWICPNGHEYETLVHYRTVRGWNCPFCSGHRVCKENCLKTVNPGIAKEWHPTKNGGLIPEDVVSGSNKKAWWICSKGHEWKATISNRSHGSGCPFCSGRKTSKEK